MRSFTRAITVLILNAVVFTGAILMVISGCQTGEEAIRDAAATVVIYSDRGVWSESVTAAERMFQWMGYDVARIGARQVRDGILDDARLLCVPGGNMYNCAEDLTAVGVERIRTFIGQGGGYLGICGGAYFAAERVFWQGNRLPMKSLGLFPGEARGPYEEIVPYPDSTMCLVIKTQAAHPVITDHPDSSWILYFWGPALLPDDGAAVDILGLYEAIDRPAMVTAEYGQGRVFLIGAHPEIEEDSDRDGVSECDELEDRGTDWELMRAATRWCLRE